LHLRGDRAEAIEHRPIITILEDAGAMPYTIILASPASDSATNQYLAPFAGAAMGEWLWITGWMR
jgi:F-type H+-transporting ATPase subunit alpha